MQVHFLLPHLENNSSQKFCAWPLSFKAPASLPDSASPGEPFGQWRAILPVLPGTSDEPGTASLLFTAHRTLIVSVSPRFSNIHRRYHRSWQTYESPQRLSGDAGAATSRGWPGTFAGSDARTPWFFSLFFFRRTGFRTARCRDNDRRRVCPSLGAWFNARAPINILWHRTPIVE